jgi:glutamyl/glutaminyl-tRNA synthetase
MTMQNPPPGSASGEIQYQDPTNQDIKPQNWLAVDDGATVFASDGEEYGTVRETMPEYLLLRRRRSLLEDIEVYVPRDLIERSERTEVHLKWSAAELDEMDLTTPPAIQS